MAAGDIIMSTVVGGVPSFPCGPCSTCHALIGDTLPIVTSSLIGCGCGLTGAGPPDVSAYIEFLTSPNGSFNATWNALFGGWIVILATAREHQFTEEDCSGEENTADFDMGVLITCAGNNRFTVSSSSARINGTVGFDEPLAGEACAPANVGGLIFTIPSP